MDDRGSADGPRNEAPAEGGIPDVAAAAGDAAPVDAASDAEGGAFACDDPLGGGPLTTTTRHLDIGVHDPSMIWDGQGYVLFATGGTLGVRRSTDLLTWTGAGNVFGAVPAWVTAALGSTPASLWAPDIRYFGGQFRLYYAGSSFGSNHSVIGLATNAALAPSTPGTQWVDQGLVIQSSVSDDFNAIDPSVAFDGTCTPWLAFGSFWSGIKLRKLDATSGKLATDDSTTYAIASRNGGAIEAASIVAHGGYFYLFVSFDACCKGVNSTYRTMVGRARSITGPYTDRAGKDMMQGAAEQLLITSGRYIGPGGGTAWRNGSGYLYSYHYYDGQDGGASKLQVRPIVFGSDDWVTLGDPVFF
jgi:arabinan endo-1,5-alpha-L-arabinosidase